MKPPVESTPQLPVRQAFVVQVAAEADVTRGHWSGRVEHVVSGTARHFRTLDELLAFMTQLLTGRHSSAP